MWLGYVGLKSSHQKKYLPNFPTQKNPGFKNLKPKRILGSSQSLEIWSTLPGNILSHVFDETKLNHILGSLRCHYVDGNKNVKKAIGLG